MFRHLQKNSSSDSGVNSHKINSTFPKIGGSLNPVRVFDVCLEMGMLFLTSELANKAEITILSARDTTRA